MLLRFQWLQTNHEPRSGRPETTTVLNVIEKIHHNVLENRPVKVREIADISISNDSMHIILTEEFEIKKILSALGAAIAHTKAETESFECLSWPFRQNPKDFLHSFITVYKTTWVLQLHSRNQRAVETMNT